MPTAFALRIITRNGVLFDRQVEHVRLPVTDGTLGVMAHHAPLVAELSYGSIAVRQPGSDKVTLFSCTGGVLHVSREEPVTVLLDAGERAEDIDLERARVSEERARARIAQASRDQSIDLERATAALERALAREETYQKRFP